MPRLNLLAAVAFGVAATGCTMTAGGVVAATVATIGIGAATKGHEIRTVYYVGVVDPLGQMPPALYRIAFRGEASLISSVRFESGWVKSELIDSLGTQVGFDPSGAVSFQKSDDGKLQIQSGRRMWLFGPEGFRRAPDDERLVVVMGSDPSAFFQAVSQVLGEVSTASQLDRQTASAWQAEVLGLLVDVGDEQLALKPDTDSVVR